MIFVHYKADKLRTRNDVKTQNKQQVLAEINKSKPINQYCSNILFNKLFNRVYAGMHVCQCCFSRLMY